MNLPWDVIIEAVIQVILEILENKPEATASSVADCMRNPGLYERIKVRGAVRQKLVDGVMSAPEWRRQSRDIMDAIYGETEKFSDEELQAFAGDCLEDAKHPPLNHVS